jgi:hypothetical protein
LCTPTNNRVKWACNSALIIFSGSTSSLAVPIMISIEASANVYTYELGNMVESHRICQAVYKPLTSSYQTGGRRYATSRATPKIAQSDYQVLIQSTCRNMWSCRKAYMVAKIANVKTVMQC